MKDKLKEILDIINHYIIIILGKLLGFIELIIKNIKIKSRNEKSNNSKKDIFKNYIIVFLLAIISFFLILRISHLNIGLNLSKSLPSDIFITEEFKNNKTKEEIIKSLNYNTLVTFKKNNKFFNKSLTKFIAGIPGDEIIIKNNNHIHIKTKHNQQVYPIGFIKKTGLNQERLNPIKSQIIPQDHYFVYSPHKDSLDSRYDQIGLIPQDNIIGITWGLNIIEFVIIFVLLITVHIVFFGVFIIGAKQLPIAKIIIIAILSIIFLHFYTKFSYSKDLGNHGTIFSIKEKDLSQSIKDKLTNLKDSGQLAKIQKQWVKKTQEKINRPTPVKGLTRAKVTSQRIHDPSITVNNNITDHQGNIIARKGQIVNPLHHKTLTQNIIFINADDKQQLDWAISRNNQQNIPPIIILTQGNIMDIMKEKKIRLFFDQNGFLTKHFNITKLPSLIYQKDDRLIIKEVAI